LKRQRVVLDACVLYPPALRDFLLTVAALDGFVPIWSPLILDEVERNVLEDNPTIDPTKFRTHTLASMLRVFPNASVNAATNADNEVALVHHGDQHVALTAIAANADSILTINQRHFPKAALRNRNITILTLGEFTQILIRNDSDLVVAALEQLARRWQNPPHTLNQIIDLLSNHPTMRGGLAQYRQTRTP
jgi:predicted nucleic acid-binding protein